MSRFRPLLAGLLAGVLVLAGGAAAQAEPPQTIRLEPKPMEGLRSGKAVVVKGKAGPDGHRFVVEGVTAMMPVTVLLRPVNRGEDVRVRISKYGWNQPLREEGTDGDIATIKFRTEGEFQATVQADTPTDYRLLVWVGEESKPEMRPIVVKASEFEPADAGGGGSLVLWVIAGLLGLGVLLLAVIVLRRKAP